MLEENRRERGDRPLVSINIPTYNEEKALPLALEAIAKQSYPKIETIVVDSNSMDDTKKIALQFGAKVINYEGRLLGARYIALTESQGEYILLLDADQILKEDTIERAVDKIKEYDMLVLEEDSYKPKTAIQKKLSKERKLAHITKDSLHPIKGGLLPRFFKKEILKRAFENIPQELYPIVVAHDHAIIYFEANKISLGIGVLSDAVSHIEPESLSEVLIHNYRFGKSTKALARTGFYKKIFSKKAFQPKTVLRTLKTKTTIMALLRSIAYKLGHYFG